MATRTYANDPTHGRPRGGKSATSLTAFEQADVTNTVSWADIEATGVMEIAAQITDMGGAIILGRTRDGGAYSITLILNDDKRRFYASSPLEMAATLQRIQQGLDKAG